MDECLSPRIALALNEEGGHVVLHPRDFGGLGASDRVVLNRYMENDLVLVTADARDFRNLLLSHEIHPGLIILPCVGRSRSEELLRGAICFLSKRGDPMDVMVNRVLLVSKDAKITLATISIKGFLTYG